MRVDLSPAAQRDLQDILRYTEQNWGRDQRERYRERLAEGMAKLADHPELGRATFGDESEFPARRFAIGSHVVIYHVTTETLYIARVVHLRRAHLLYSDLN